MNTSRFISVSLALLATALPASFAAQSATSAPAPQWEHTGWGGGGWFWATAYHPTKSGTIYIGLDVGGVAKTTDHGLTWKIVNNGLTNYAAYSLAVDRKNPETVYVATEDGLHKSTDGAATWKLLPSTRRAELRITGERNHSVRSIAVDPTDGNILYAATPGGKIYKSTDTGETWSVVFEKKSPGTAAPAPFHAVAVSAKNPALVVAATDDSGLVLSEDAGRTWRELDTPKKASSAMFAETDSSVMFGSFYKDGIWKSTDTGKTWTRLTEGVPANATFREIAVSPANTLDVYAIGSTVLVSNDGGKSWKQSMTLNADLTGNPTRHYNGEEPTTNIVHPMNITFNPTNPKELFISSDWRAAWSGDGGTTWHERERGADISCITDIRFSKGRAYTTAMDEGTLVSEDNGKTWRQLWPLKYLPDTSGHYWRIAVNTIDGVDQIVSAASPWNTPLRRVVFSADGGKTFTDTISGLPDYIPTANTMWGQGHPRALAVDPNDPRIVYLGLDGDATEGKSGGGIFKSEDGGATWKQLPNQPSSRRMYYGLAVDPTDSKRIFWGACAANGGVHRTQDGGKTWERVFDKESYVWNIHVTKEGVIYCGGSQLWRSTDHGTTWSQVGELPAGRSVVGIETDPRDAKTVWISQTTWNASAIGGIYKTSDAGVTWQDITGDIPYSKPQVLRFNPETNELWSGWVGLYKIKQ
ncbi:WD40/YVTN/BNR-like repeat-containing protein [Rariglobus hedericola]|uniref:Sortilin N-terminal domain-containing protein n=1 Tax=Rariglobus hedericola TaxID=2597822 RepID=A0A556QL44_9BACT|nr:sialidase family protein [Rariglobus hedericola]TSJ77322.1 hypothetical protein FPL22_14605 [Rariglobus hedericola]